MRDDGVYGDIEKIGYFLVDHTFGNTDKDVFLTGSKVAAFGGNRVFRGRYGITELVDDVGGSIINIEDGIVLADTFFIEEYAWESDDGGIGIFGNKMPGAGLGGMGEDGGIHDYDIYGHVFQDGLFTGRNVGDDTFHLEFAKVMEDTLDTPCHHTGRHYKEYFHLLLLFMGFQPVHYGDKDVILDIRMLLQVLGKREQGI